MLNMDWRGCCLRSVRLLVTLLSSIVKRPFSICHIGHVLNVCDASSSVPGAPDGAARRTALRP